MQWQFMFRIGTKTLEMTYQPTKTWNHCKTRCYGNRQLNELKTLCFDTLHNHYYKKDR